MAAAITTADDTIHPPTNDDPFWTEALWVGFAIPAKKIAGAIYPIFRPNQKICSLGVYVWDDNDVVDQDILYFQNMWHLPIPADLRDMKLGNFTFRSIDPLKKYEAVYDDGVELRVELQLEGLHEPFASVHDSTVTGYTQLCHVTGLMRLNGDELEIDSYEMRGCGWGPRSDARPSPRPVDPNQAISGAASYGASGNSAFMVHSYGTLDSGQVMDGFLLRDGRYHSVVSGQRTIVKRGAERGYPQEVIVEGVDDAGRSFRAVGTGVNRILMQATPGMISWACGMTWDLDGEQIWGEDHEAPGRPAHRVGGKPW
jgi:hypothetical protein